MTTDGSCPTPKKSRFATIEAAQSAALNARIVLMKSLYPYDECPCGWVHLTSRPPQQRSEPRFGDGPVDDDLFALVVRDDIGGRCAEEDAAKLRSPQYVARWAEMLKTMQISCETQLSQKAGWQDPDTRAWRARVKRFQFSLRDRRREAAELSREHFQSRVRTGSPYRDPDTKELRRTAGERAVQRLKDAHSKEFLRYLAEEYVAEGLPLTEKLLRHLPEQAVPEEDNSEEKVT